MALGFGKACLWDLMSPRACTHACSIASLFNSPLKGCVYLAQVDWHMLPTLVRGYCGIAKGQPTPDPKDGELNAGELCQPSHSDAAASSGVDPGPTGLRCSRIDNCSGQFMPRHNLKQAQEFISRFRVPPRRGYYRIDGHTTSTFVTLVFPERWRKRRGECNA
jgi:hypothetical protein